jgi:hypothetical protein
MSTGVIVIEEGGRKALAVPTGVSAADFIRSEIGSLQRESGWIVHDGGIEPWLIHGFTQREGQVHFWGDYVHGVQLEDCLDDSPEANLARLKSLTSALIRLRADKVPVFPLRTDGVSFLDDGSVLFMPPGMMQRIALLRPFSERVRTYNVINNPDVSGERAQSHSLGVLAYRMLLGEYPFTGEDDVAVNSRIRSLRVTPPSLQKPELSTELSDGIVRSIDRASKGHLTLEEWDALLFRSIAQGHLREVSEAERNAAFSRAREKSERSQKAYRRAVFFQRQWRLMAIVGGVLVVVGAVLGSILSNVLAPRVTRGFSPRKVVETFYTSMNTLDHMTMEDCVVNRAGQGEVNEAMNLFVLSRATMGYEGTSHIVSAADWDKEGRPELSSDKSLYGAIVREVKEEQGEPAPVFLVTYQKWAPEPEATATSPDETRRNYGYDRVDRVRLKKDKGDWVINEIDRLSSIPVGKS